jgi:hypothetical protein
LGEGQRDGLEEGFEDAGLLKGADFVGTSRALRGVWGREGTYCWSSIIETMRRRE